MRLQLKRGLALALVLVARVAHAEDAPTEQADPPAPKTREYDVRVSSEVAGYADTDHVFVVSPTISGRVSSPTGGWDVGGRYLVDVVSAASVDIVATASQNWHEVRHVGTVDGTYKPHDTGISATVDVSSEPDYLALTGGVSVTQDLLDKDLTLLLGWSHSHDIAGRGGTPFSVFNHQIETDGIKGGATFILDRSTILSVVGDVFLERGDSSKPYRYIPMFAPGANVPVGASIDLVNQLRLSYRPLEQLPLSRQRFALSGRLAHRTSSTTTRLDERLYTDSWGLNATTTDVRVLFDLGSRVEVGPHARFHIQSPVSFWQRAYSMTGAVFPALRTGDRELGPLYNVTGGGRLALAIGPTDDPRTWLLGLDFNVTQTRYLDDLYVTNRLSAVGSLSLEVEF